MKTFSTLWLKAVVACSVAYGMFQLLLSRPWFAIAVVGISMFCAGVALERPRRT